MTPRPARPGCKVCPVFPHPLCLLLCLLAFWPLGQAQAQGARPPQYTPGIRTIGVWMPEIQARLDIVVWYPSASAPSAVHIDGRELAAARDGSVIPGRYPLILMSHESASSRTANYDLAAGLARLGFIVIAPTHPGDNIDDTSFLYRGVLFRDRPRHLLLALEAVLASPELGPRADPGRIGLIGVGSGSATVLQLAGAEPDFTNFPAYCATRPGLDPHCTPWAMTRFDLLLQEYEQIRTNEGDKAFTPPLDSFAPDSSAPTTPDAPPATRTLRSIVLMTPGLAALFPPERLGGIQVPVAIATAAEDSFYPVDRNAEALRRAMARVPAYLSIANAGHADLQSPCPPDAAPNVEPLCAGNNDAALDIRAERSAFIGQFLQQTLGMPLAAE